jgi:hypothetical protein
MGLIDGGEHLGHVPPLFPAHPAQIVLIYHTLY